MELYFSSIQVNFEYDQMVILEQGEHRRFFWRTHWPKVLRGGPMDLAKLVMKLAPMEICTFIVEFIFIFS